MINFLKTTPAQRLSIAFVALGVVALTAYVTHYAVLNPPPADVPPNTSTGTSAAADPSRPQLASAAPVRGAFEIPFVGKVEADVTTEQIQISMADGVVVNREFKVYRSSNGNFLRAEYHPPGSERFEFPVSKIYRAIKMRDQEIIGLSKAVPRVSWQRILNIIADSAGLDQAQRINVTLVDYRLWEEPIRATYLVHVYGAESASDKPGLYNPNSDLWKRIRFLVDFDGNVLRFDNCL